jgi:hypothetical protein
VAKTRHDLVLFFNVSVSIFGLFIVLFWAFNPPFVYEDFLWRKPLVGSVFSLICFLGILAALFPKQCSKSSHFQEDSETVDSGLINASSHHPDCQEFSAHVIRLGGRKSCAACVGLLVGAIIALIGTALYFFIGLRIENWELQAILIGTIATFLGFLQLRFRGFARSTLNTAFVVGAFLVLIGTDSMAENLFVDLFLMALIVFWILTRIQLSQWDHQRICRGCKSPCGIRNIERK